MKKLKKWQIVLLVIFYPVGLCVLLYRMWEKYRRQREYEAAQIARMEAKAQAEAAQKEKEEKEKEERRKKRVEHEIRKFKVVGVTFKNDDGTSRQTLLRKMYFGKAPFNSDEGVSITIEESTYEGNPAFPVFAEGYQVGYISKEDVPFFVKRWKDFDSVISVDVSDGCADNEEHNIIYGMVIHCFFRKQAENQ